MTLVMQPRGGLRTKDIKLKRVAQLNKKTCRKQNFRIPSRFGDDGTPDVGVSESKFYIGGAAGRG